MSGSNRPLALITGASAGIGATFARALASRGYDLILSARRQDRLDALAAELRQKHHVECETLAADLATDEGMERVAARIASADRLELLVSNAGFGEGGTFWELPVKGQMDMHRVHVLATVRLNHTALAAMAPRGRGGVINVASVAGFVQSPGAASYGATKRWMIGFTEGLFLELKRAGSAVKVQALCPGFTYSEFHDVARMDRNAIPKGLWMQPESVVEASLAGLERGQLIVVPGWKYKLLVCVLGLVPAGLIRWGSTRWARRREGK